MQNQYGQSIKENDVIVYAVRGGSSHYVHIARVVKLLENSAVCVVLIDGKFSPKPGRHVRLTSSLSNCVVLDNTQSCQSFRDRLVALVVQAGGANLTREQILGENE
jgi:hypothetical protein